MARTRQQLAAALSVKHGRKRLNSAVWQDILDGIAGFDIAAQDNLLDAVVTGKTKKAGRILTLMLSAKLQVMADAEITAALADDNITPEELDAILP
jgi:hypothetical protein